MSNTCSADGLRGSTQIRAEAIDWSRATERGLHLEEHRAGSPGRDATGLAVQQPTEARAKCDSEIRFGIVKFAWSGAALPCRDLFEQPQAQDRRILRCTRAALSSPGWFARLCTTLCRQQRGDSRNANLQAFVEAGRDDAPLIHLRFRCSYFGHRNIDALTPKKRVLWLTDEADRHRHAPLQVAAVQEEARRPAGRAEDHRHPACATAAAQRKPPSSEPSSFAAEQPTSIVLRQTAVRYRVRRGGRARTGQGIPQSAFRSPND